MFRTTTLALLAAAVLAAPGAMAQTTTKTFAAAHPRRAEVNGRLIDQKNRVDRLKDQGKINNQQALQLHHEDQHIHNEQRALAAHQDGHITAAQQAKLNRQENAVNRSITLDKAAP